MRQSQRVEQYRKFLLGFAAQQSNPEHGFFGPQSMAWQVNREGVLGLGAMRALLMQIAHPKVAQGVADHSNFLTRPFQRAYSTLKAQQVIVFGTCDQAIDTLVRVYARHLAVRGSMPDNGDEDNRYYEGTDSWLSFWIFATLIDTILQTYALFLRPMSELEQNLFYEESKRFATLMGIEQQHVPQTLEEFHSTLGVIMASSEIHLTSCAQDIARSLMRLPAPFFYPVNYILAAGMLPPKIRDQLDIKWNRLINVLFRVVVIVARVMVRLLPQRLRATPFYWQARARTSVGGG